MTTASTLVTGGIGFVGRYVVEDLIARGEHVISYNRDFATSSHPLVTTVQGELFDIPKLVRTIGEYQVKHVIHTAAMSHPEISIDLPVTTFAANVDGTLHLLEAIRLTTGVERVVNFSSECAYGDQDEKRTLREDALPRPNTPYGVTKVATELLGRVYSGLYGVDVISLRITEVYGPGLKMPELLRDMLIAAVRGHAYHLAEGGAHRFQFVHAQDVARAAVLARTAKRLQDFYNISGGCQVTVQELADVIRTRFPDADFKIGPGHLTGWDRQGPFDISAAGRDLGYIPGWTLERGLDAYAAWLREHDF
jgi:UDP-glucose 4-epimerase